MPRKISLKTLRKRAWDACSQYVRQFYADSRGYTVCYTCGATDQWKAMQCGHAIPGRSNSVLLDTDILRVQCPTCNIFKRGQYHIFATKLIKEHGLDWWEAKLTHSKQIVKYTKSDYEQIAEDFNLKTRQLSVSKRAEKWKMPKIIDPWKEKP